MFKTLSLATNGVEWDGPSGLACLGGLVRILGGLVRILGGLVRILGGLVRILGGLVRILGGLVRILGGLQFVGGNVALHGMTRCDLDERRIDDVTRAGNEPMAAGVEHASRRRILRTRGYHR